jgi:hypothetical protein
MPTTSTGLEGKPLKPGTFAGVALLAMATLMYQLLLTRIFSVTMWYHFAFMAISITMFGMTVGAIAVYRLPNVFRPERVSWHLSLSAVGFAVTTIGSFLVHLHLPFVVDLSFVHLCSVAATYLVIALPFISSGVAMALAMTRFPGQVGRLYAADLVGAGLGCPLLVGLLGVIDAPSAVFVVAFIGASASLFFLRGAGEPKLARVSGGVTAALAVVAALVAVAGSRHEPLFRVTWVKGEQDLNPIYERWNSFSRITVYDHDSKPFGWGMSDRLPPSRRAEQRMLSIDAIGDTVLTKFDGDLTSVDHLGYDVTNLAHYLRPDSRVLTIGVGGGRDILSALYFKQRSVTGVEINDAIVRALTRDYGDYTGHLERQPGVTLVNDEARSFIARTDQTFDVIEVSLIDTFAATAAGAYVLTENSLYTIGAWGKMLERLSPAGILSFSRWYYNDRPGEVYRLTSLASAALLKEGISEPRDHIIIARKMGFFGPDTPDGVGTLLVSKTPFSAHDQEVLEQVTQRLGFDIVLSPRTSLDDTFARLASGKDLEAFTAAYPLDISPPTDDQPFFFHMLRPRDMLNPSEQGIVSFNMRAVQVLEVLLVLVVALTALCILAPLFLTRRRGSVRGSTPLLLYFLGIGFGFMLVEIAAMQRLNLFLGHPIYGMTVVLFCLLLASGGGSYLSSVIVPEGSALRRAALCLTALVVVVAATGKLGPWIFARFEAATTPVRILVAVATLIPLGLSMGMAFPLGMRVASRRSSELAPWLWGINGAASVCASVVAVFVSLTSGISTAYGIGVVCYVVAVAAFLWANQKEGLADAPATQVPA